MAIATIYIDVISSDMILAFFPDDGEGYTFRSMEHLQHDCLIDYGEDFELIEITEENQEELQEKGIFDLPFI